MDETDAPLNSDTQHGQDPRGKICGVELPLTVGLTCTTEGHTDKTERVQSDRKELKLKIISSLPETLPVVKKETNHRIEPDVPDLLRRRFLPLNDFATPYMQ